VKPSFGGFPEKPKGEATLAILAFVNTGITGEALQLLSAIILGLGLAQSKSRVPS
jgi:hypothetical protein